MGKPLNFYKFTSFRTVVQRLQLLATTSEVMAVNLRGRGQSPEAKDGYVAINSDVVDNIHVLYTH